ncbi:multi drug resistance-associated protein, partial [Aphelenchoides avenae]
KADPAKCERLRRQISQKATDSAVGSLDDDDDASKEKFETARDGPAPTTPTTKTPKAAETPVAPVVPAKAVANGTTEKSKLIEKEGIQTGKVKFLVYLSYIRAIGYGITTAFFFIYVIRAH